MNWVQYANQGAIRNQPLAPDLLNALSFLPEMGIEMKVYSGGQAPKGSGGPRTGSTRHDHGNAADADFYYQGRKLDWNNPDDVPIFQEMVRRGKQRGLTGWGAGDDYMGAGRMHVGFGNPGVWGAGGKGANAPGWLREAYHGEPGHVHKPGDENQKIADATMAALGKDPVSQPSGGGGDKVLVGGLLGDTMGADMAEYEPEKAGGLLGKMFPNMTANRRDEIKMALAGMSLNPNQALVRGLEGRMEGRREDEREFKAEQKAQEKANRTLQVLRQSGVSEQDIQMAATNPDYMRALVGQIAKTRLAGEAKPEYVYQDGQWWDKANPQAGPIQTPGGEKPIDTKGESDLRKEYTGLNDVKDFKKQADAFARIRASADQPDAAGDLALIFNYMKLLDPGSVVREGEFATAQNAAGIDERTRNVWNRLQSGERLAPEQRNEFVNRAGKIYESARTQNESTETQYRQNATDYGYDPKRAIPDVSYQSPYAAQRSPRPGQRPEAPQSAPQGGQADTVRKAIQSLTPFDRQLLEALPTNREKVQFLQQRGLL